MKSKQAESASPGYMSPPARGAWIEILLFQKVVSRSGRPPRGGRGLKLFRWICHGLRPWSPPARGAWIEISVQPSSV